MVQVILIERVEKLGKIGDVVEVKPGYARNFLLPKNKALRSTKENLVAFENRRADIEAQDGEKSSVASRLADTLNGKEIILIRAASESGQLYGSVTARDIATEITTQLSQNITRNQVILEVPVKQLGIFPQKINLHGDVNAIIELNVAKTEDEAKTQRQKLIDAANKQKAKAERMAEKPWEQEAEKADAAETPEADAKTADAPELEAVADDAPQADNAETADTEATDEKT
ncbi:MAG: 50S ribosomal protein L9 [Alphaproteobacteria bacterium]|nr:50S ribosomal protein L9 [Alphaproteobacteria bacterium]